MAKSAEIPDYGLDTPAAVRKSLLLGAAGVAFSVGLTFSRNWAYLYFGIVLGLFSCIPLATAILRMAYSSWGKLRVRDKMIGSVEWSGTERVLDFGTGRGLLVTAAAKKLTTGKAIGVDIWRPDDLAGGNRRNAQLNVELEGVQQWAEIQREEPKSLSFADDSFDVVLSHYYLHYLRRPVDRERACQEIGRVLKPGGIAVIADNEYIEDYLAAFARAQCAVRGDGPARLNFFPAIRMFTVRKAMEQAG